MHEIKYDGYRMHARIDGGDIKLLTRTGLDWSRRYERTIQALHALPAKSAYLDGELCALNPDGVPVLSRLQAAMDEGRTDQQRRRSPVCAIANTSRATVPASGSTPVSWAWKVRSRSSLIDPMLQATGGYGSSRKCMNREEFVVVGWTESEGSRSHIGALLLGYYTDDGRLLYAGRAGTGMTDKELKRLACVLAPLEVPKMPLSKPPSRDSRLGSRLKLSRVHWVRPELVVEVTYLTWTEDNLLRQVSYQGQREDKPARQFVRPAPHPKRKG